MSCSSSSARVRRVFPRLGGLITRTVAYAATIAEPASPGTSAPLAAPGAVRIRRALISVSDKRGIGAFGRGLADLGIEIVSTGGTAQELERAGVEVRPIEDFTGFPEMLDGRVKTLHPRLYAGLLAVRSDPEHMRAAAEHGIELVDLVCVNLYPFERAVAQRHPDPEEVVENIDVGGPAMLRAAAKNHAFAAVVCDPDAYEPVLGELRAADGTLSPATRRRLAAQAFAATARYDIAIARWFGAAGDALPALDLRAYEKVADLPYGENPHQRAAYYAQAGARSHLLSRVRQLHGKPLSFNNLLDLDAARAIVRELPSPACAIVKHNNPCGAATGGRALDAYRRAFACDPMSAYGGIIVLDERVDRETAQALSEQFVEVLLAPGFDDEALAILTRKPNVRLLEDAERRRPTDALDARQVRGGLLIQDRDVVVADPETMQIATRRGPTDAEWEDLLFAWRVSRYVKSNAIVLARGAATVGIGAGQMSRVDAVRLALEKCRLDDLAGTVLASDAFFPFADGPQLAFAAGVRAIIQPGGSVRDEEVVASADAAGATMVLTGRRHFRH
jgi:phosphoribosylaminoimidazolecarboxamide formyltransferase/IMP cyclohydrolase